MMDTALSTPQRSKQMKRHQRYHVRLGTRRTTVSLDTMLSNLLSLKLNARPETPEAHHAVCRWLQTKLDEANDPGRVLVSDWLMHEVILDLIPRELDQAYGEWISSQPG